MQKNKSLWLFVATAPGGAFATIEAINSIKKRLKNVGVSLCFSVQDPKDEVLLRERYEHADIFYPSLDKVEKLNDKKRYRSAIHSEILNQGWKRRVDSDYGLIFDNDIVLTGSGALDDVLEFLTKKEIKIIGTEYSKTSYLQKLRGYKQIKPLGVPNCIFSLIDMNFYNGMEKICLFKDMLENDVNPKFDKSYPVSLRNKIIDAGQQLYLEPIKRNKKTKAIKCRNTFHYYLPNSMRHYFFGGDDSPEIYKLEGFDITIHHFKKLSNLKSESEMKLNYYEWLNKL